MISGGEGCAGSRKIHIPYARLLKVLTNSAMYFVMA